MTRPADTARTDEIARVAHAIWEAEGRPDGRDHEHWIKAKQIVEEGRADAEYPAAPGEAASGGPASDDETYVRPAGPEAMDLPPSSWSKTDEEVDESFPASDPPGNY